MKPSTRTRLAEISYAVGIAIAAGAWFFADELSWLVLAACLASFVGLLLVGSWLSPPFWWGKRKFTTPLTEPSHSTPAEPRASSRSTEST